MYSLQQQQQQQQQQQNSEPSMLETNLFLRRNMK